MSYHKSILLLVALFVGAATTARASIHTFADPANDTFGSGSFQQDIKRITAEVTGTDLTFTVEFYNDILPPSAIEPSPAPENVLLGFIDIDVDQSKLTGTPSNVSSFGIPPSGLGVEYFVELESEKNHAGSVEVLDAATFLPVDIVPISFASNSFSLTIPLASIGGDDGHVNFGAIMGTITESTDQVLGNTRVIPEPGSLAVWGLLSAIGLLALTRPSPWLFRR